MSGCTEEEAVVNPIEKLTEQIEVLQNQVLAQEEEISRLFSIPKAYATVVSHNHKINPDAYEPGLRVLIIDKKLEGLYRRVGKVLTLDKEAGTIRVEVFGLKDYPNLAIGMPDADGKPVEKQIQLLDGNDGTNVVISVEGALKEVWNNHGFDPKPGDTAKVNDKTNQIEEVGPPTMVGAMCVVEEIIDSKHIQVEVGGHKRAVFCNLAGISIADRVVLDHENNIVVRHLSSVSSNKHKVHSDNQVTWDDIAGVDSAKAELQDAIELPYIHPEIFQHYNQTPPCGILLYGPPGCGKTLLGRASHNASASIHGKKEKSSGFIYIKGPEILTKWVGEPEATTRGLFNQMRKHFVETGYPAVMFVDEADSLFPERGTVRDQHWNNTIVATWLSEMDGFDRSNGILIFATNRPRSLDAAFCREGRIDRHVKVARPTAVNAPDYFKLHLKKVPLDGTCIDEVASVATDEIFNKPRILFNVRYMGKGEPFGLFNCLSGSMIKAITERARMTAMKRDISSSGKSGVRMEDIIGAIDDIYKNHIALNHKFDVEDFCEVLGWAAKNVKLEAYKPEEVAAK